MSARRECLRAGDTGRGVSPRYGMGMRAGSGTRDAVLSWVVRMSSGLLLAGTCLANPWGMDTPAPNLASIPVMGEVTPAPGAGSAVAAATCGPQDGESTPGGLFETLIAD